jgi:preprotein translocase SecE subunit
VFTVHKPGQAKASRMVTLLAGLFLILWATRSLVETLPRIHDTLGRAWNEILSGAAPSDATQLDLVIAVYKFSPGLTIGLVFLVLASLAFYWWVNRPSIADRLIDMEGELRKVSWPSFPDAWQSTLVVSGFTALVVILVFVFDFVIKSAIHLMPKGGGS